MLSEKSLSPKLFVAILLLTLVLLVSCGGNNTYPNSKLSLEYYDSLSSPSFHISPKNVRRELQKMIDNDNDSTLGDYYARKYYVGHGSFVWISRKGVTEESDTLLARLGEVEKIGFNPSRFRFSDIKADLERVHKLRFNKSNTVSKVFARLEYNLTKALFRFSSGQRFGYTVPSNLLNHLDLTNSHDKSCRSFRQLYTLKSDRPGENFFYDALNKTREGKLVQFLDSCEPHSPLYDRLLSIVNNDSARLFNRGLLLVNLERSRWRLTDYPWKHDKYVMVNLPTLHLMAKSDNNVLVLRIGCGANSTKTPIMNGYINRIDVNPQWIMPRSIVKKSVIHRLGNPGWFSANHYFIRDRATGENIEPSRASEQALLDGSQLAIQEGGDGNALGRLIFRFDNGLSIYLHDTSSKDVFDKAERDVSHGCIRVDIPFELVKFLLGTNENKTVRRIWYSINADVSPLGKAKKKLSVEQRVVADTLRRDMLIGQAKVSPQIPVFLWYYTLYPDANGILRTYGDIYGYDKIILDYLKNYL